MSNEYRVISKMYTKHNRNGESWSEMKQFLQKKTKRFFGIVKWETIDEESVPSFAWVHKASFGDESNWKSKFNGITNCTFVKYEK